MPLIHLETPVNAPPARVFDLAIDVDAHQASAAATGERAIAGVTSGRMKLGDSVTWEARHLGLRLHLTAKITGYDRPREFSDAQTKGPFARMSHRHVFRETPSGCVMVDDFDFRSPLGPLGWIADALFVRRHLESFLRGRAEFLKRRAEEGSP